MMWLCERMSLESFRSKEQCSQLIQERYACVREENSTANEQIIGVLDFHNGFMGFLVLLDSFDKFEIVAN